MLSLPLSYRNNLGCPCQDQPALGSFGKQINWDTAPVINSYPYNRDGYWDCNDWMTWHKKISAKYGVARANEVFMIWWNKQGYFDYAASSCMLLNSEFRGYFNSVGLKLDDFANYVTKPIDLVSKTQATVLDTAGKVVDATGQVISNTADAAKSTSGVLKYAIPLVVTGVIAGAGYYIYKNYLKGDRKVSVGPVAI